MSDKVVLVVRFVPKPGMYAAFRQSLVDLIETMKAESDFLDGVLHDDLDYQGELVFYETWRGTKERWLHEQPGKPYREAYEKLVPSLLERRHISWLAPIGAWRQSMSESDEALSTLKRF